MACLKYTLNEFDATLNLFSLSNIVCQQRRCIFSIMCIKFNCLTYETYASSLLLLVLIYVFDQFNVFEGFTLISIAF